MVAPFSTYNTCTDCIRDPRHRESSKRCSVTAANLLYCFQHRRRYIVDKGHRQTELGQEATGNARSTVPAPPSCRLANVLLLQELPTDCNIYVHTCTITSIMNAAGKWERKCHCSPSQAAVAAGIRRYLRVVFFPFNCIARPSPTAVPGTKLLYPTDCCTKYHSTSSYTGNFPTSRCVGACTSPSRLTHALERSA